MRHVAPATAAQSCRHRDVLLAADTERQGKIVRVIGAVFEVSNTLGAGFLEKVYERALLRELGLLGIRATSQTSFSITYKGRNVGDYFADILVEDKLVVELKCVERLANEHTAQSWNYLRAAGLTSVFQSISRSPKSSGGE